MKKAAIIILAVALMLALASCNIADIIGTTSSSSTTTPLKSPGAAYESGTIKLRHEETKYNLSEGDADTISAIFAKYTFIEFPQPDTATDYEITIGETKYFYHSGTGTLFCADKHCFLSEADKEAVNKILFAYVSPEF